MPVECGIRLTPPPGRGLVPDQQREALKEWLNWQKDGVGFAGWRFDFAKVRAPHFLGPAFASPANKHAS